MGQTSFESRHATHPLPLPRGECAVYLSNRLRKSYKVVAQLRIRFVNHGDTEFTENRFSRTFLRELRVSMVDEHHPY